MKWGRGEKILRFCKIMVKKKRRKRRKFKKNPIEMIVEVVILIVLVPTFFKLSLLVGFGYLFAIFVLFYLIYLFMTSILIFL